MGTIAILQARMSSSRLPGKVLADVDGIPMIQRQIERVLKANLVDQLVVATSTEPSDDPLADFLADIGQDYYRGTLDNVLNRFVQILDSSEFETCVRLTGDCPLADWNVIDQVISKFKVSDVDYCSNTLKRTFPRGLDVEVVRSSVLLELGASATNPLDLEHVTHGIYTKPEKYRMIGLEQTPSFSNFRWTVDEQRDLDFVRMVYKSFHELGIELNQTNLIDWLLKNPENILYEY